LTSVTTPMSNRNYRAGAAGGFKPKVVINSEFNDVKEEEYED